MSRLFPRSPALRHDGTLLGQIELRQFAILAEQARASIYTGTAVIVMTLLLAPRVDAAWLIISIALVRMALFLHDNMLARTFQQQIAQGAPRVLTLRRMIAASFCANFTWGMLTWPLQIGEEIGFVAFMLAIIALFSICLSIVSASFHPKALRASTLGGCLGLAPKIYLMTASVGLLLPVGFLIYCMTMYYFGRVLGRQSRGGIALDIRRKRIARQLGRTNQALQRALTEANRLAEQDGLTLLRNRRAFELALPRFTAAWSDHDCFLMLIDIDHFKRINDRFGHAMGDGVLMALGTALTEWEVEGDRRISGRWGGEEFIAVIALPPGMPPGPAANDLRERIQELTEGLHWPGPVEISASIGCARLEGADQFDVALRRADAALYAAKSAGRNCWKLAA